MARRVIDAEKEIQHIVDEIKHCVLIIHGPHIDYHSKIFSLTNPYIGKNGISIINTIIPSACTTDGALFSDNY